MFLILNNILEVTQERMKFLFFHDPFIVNVLLTFCLCLPGTQVFILNAQKTKSPLSSLLRKHQLSDTDYTCLKELLRAGAAHMAAPYHCPCAPLVKLIVVDKPSVIQVGAGACVTI